ncbi:MAG: indole-3-glycerol phosphate synthase TrpC [Spirochaetota bacterium]
MSIVDSIAHERLEAVTRRKRERPESTLERLASPPRASFDRSLPFALIAECKRASPSRGVLLDDYDPAVLARAYEGGGAAMISVLTEPLHFLGDDAHLSSAREAVSLPVLRKDFIVDRYQIAESWAIGADLVLLIASLHDAASLRRLTSLAHDRGMGVLLEVHDAVELERARDSGADAIGINARDLRDFSVDSSRAKALAGSLGEGYFMVAESGMRAPSDAVAMLEAGFRGFLVGEALVAAASPGEAAKAFVAALSSAHRPGGRR